MYALVDYFFFVFHRYRNNWRLQKDLFYYCKTLFYALAFAFIVYLYCMLLVIIMKNYIIISCHIFILAIIIFNY